MRFESSEFERVHNEVATRANLASAVPPFQAEWAMFSLTDYVESCVVKDDGSTRAVHELVVRIKSFISQGQGWPPTQFTPAVAVSTI